MSRGFVGTRSPVVLDAQSDNTAARANKSIAAIVSDQIKKSKVYGKRQDISEFLSKKEYFKALDLSEELYASKEANLQDIRINTEIVNKIINSFSSFLNYNYSEKERTLIEGMQYFEKKIRRNEMLERSFLNHQEHEASPIPFLVAVKRNCETSQQEDMTQQVRKAL